MKYTVKIMKKGYWSVVYGEDAKVISYLTGYKLYKKRYRSSYICKFPTSSVERISNILQKCQVDHMFIHSNKKPFTYENNKYQQIAKGDISIANFILKDDIDLTNIVSGTFSVQFKGEPIEQYVIGESISSEASIVREVLICEPGNCFTINGEEVLLVSKEIDL